MSAVKLKNGVLAVVADGLGGHQNGEYASREAVSTVNRFLIGEEISEDSLEDAILEADEAVRLLHETAPGALTTIGVLWLCANQAMVAHVGDTRVYQFRNGKVLFQTSDHSAAQLAVLAGEIEPEGIRGHRGRNKLIRVLGAEDAPRVDERQLDVHKGDRFLVCSDGFWEQITEDKMIETAKGNDGPDVWLSRMRAIVEPNAKDNNTAIAIVIS